MSNDQEYTGRCHECGEIIGEADGNMDYIDDLAYCTSCIEDKNKKMHKMASPIIKLSMDLFSEIADYKKSKDIMVDGKKCEEWMLKIMAIQDEYYKMDDAEDICTRCLAAMPAHSGMQTERGIICAECALKTI